MSAIAEKQPVLLGLTNQAIDRAEMEGTGLGEARRSFVDTAACVLAARTSTQRLGVERASGRLRATSSASFAALRVGAVAHALDFDDYETPGSTHPSATLVAALLALADPEEHTVEEMLRGYIAGYEVIVGLGRLLGYSHYDAGWHATSTIGAVGAATAAGTLIGLRGHRLASAAALATSMSSGLKAQFGTDAKALHAGFAARAGVEAAVLAEQGLVANTSIIEAPLGVLDVFGGPDSPRMYAGEVSAPAICTDRPLRKPWPSCAYTHRSIDAALSIRDALPSGVDRPVSVVVRIPEPFHRVVAFRHPVDPQQARFSLTYCVAAALLDGEITEATFSEAAVARADVAAMEALIDVDAYVVAGEIDDMSPKHPDAVTVWTGSGAHTAEVRDVPGGPARPMSDAAIVDKYALSGGDPARAFGALTAALDRPASDLIDCFEEFRT